MKHLTIFSLLILFVFLLPENSKAQTLEFSQVLNISTVEDTVPSGKVWKVTNLLATNINNGGASPYIYIISVNGVNMHVGHSAMAEYDMALPSNNFLPFWFPEGTRLRAVSNIGLLSVIEFTVTP